MAHSGGSIIGIQAVAKVPELYAAYIGVGQISYQLKSEILACHASGYSESRWPGEYVSYYRFYAPSQDIDNVLNRFMFKKTKYKSTPKFLKMNTQPDWWNLSELNQANIYSNGKRWLIYDKSIGLAYLYSSSGEFGVGSMSSFTVEKGID
jgi:hypothetical protein